MTITISRAVPTRPINRGHPVCQGAYAALVFSGHREVLGELPGEYTADTPMKFALADPRLTPEMDFASSPGMPLRHWNADEVRPTPAVCFVFDNVEHPFVESLLRQGAVRHEHFMTIEDVCAGAEESIRQARLDDLLQQIGSKARVLLLGFGDQGSAIAAELASRFNLDRARMPVVDTGLQSAARARTLGHEVVDSTCGLMGIDAVIYTPLMRFGMLQAILQRAMADGVPVLDNASPSSGLGQFRTHGIMTLEPAADRALLVRGTRISSRPHGLPLEINCVRLEERTLGGKCFPHLHAGQRFTLCGPEKSVDVAAAAPHDPLAPSTRGALRQAWIGLGRRHAMPVFAARDFAQQLWPEATRAVIPARCAADLGATRLERMIKRHIDQQEILMAAQTTLQQVVLGVAARHYAACSPLVEIGSALGGSAMLMAAATDEQRPPLVSIDPQSASRHLMRFGFEQIEQGKRLQQVIEPSDVAIRSLQHLRGQAGLVFIDGLHTERGCASDIRNYAPLVRPGGCLLIHDAEPARFSVLRVLIELVLPDPRFAMICMIDGLAVLERRD